MVRKLKHHEMKLLKKVDFYNYKFNDSAHEHATIRKFHLTDPADYKKYDIILGQIKTLSNKLSLLAEEDPIRIQITNDLMKKLYDMGLISVQGAKLSACSKVTMTSFCRRRLAVICVKLRMAQRVSDATRLIEQGHIRVGVDTITDPAFLVTKNMEDFVTWVNTSSIKRKVENYNNRLDDYDLL